MEDIAFEAAVLDGLCNLFSIEGLFTPGELRAALRRLEAEQKITGEK